MFSIIAAILLFAAAFADTSLPDVGTRQKIGNPFFEGPWHYPASPDFAAGTNSFWVFTVSKNPEHNGTLSVSALSSTDTKNWERHDDIIDLPGFNWANASSIFSPAPVLRNNKYYLYFSTTAYLPGKTKKSAAVGKYSGIRMGVSDKPEGPYKNPLPDNKALLPIDDPTVAEPYGPAVLIDKDRAYIYYGYHGSLYFRELNDNMTSFRNKSQPLTMPPGDFRGIKVFRRGDIYYTLWNDGQVLEPLGTRSFHSIRYAMSQDPEGPFHGGNVLLAGDPAIAHSVFYGDVLHVKDDTWYLFYSRLQSLSAVGDRLVQGLAWEQMHFRDDGTIEPVAMEMANDFLSDYKWTEKGLPAGLWPSEGGASAFSVKANETDPGIMYLQPDTSRSSTQAAHGMLLTGFGDFAMDVSIKMQADNDTATAGVIFGASISNTTEEKWAGHALDVARTGGMTLSRVDATTGRRTVIATGTSDHDQRRPQDDFVDIRIQVEGTHIRVFWGGKVDMGDEIIDYKDTVYRRGWTGFRAEGAVAMYQQFRISKVKGSPNQVEPMDITPNGNLVLPA